MHEFHSSGLDHNLKLQGIILEITKSISQGFLMGASSHQLFILKAVSRSWKREELVMCSLLKSSAAPSYEPCFGR